MGENTNVSFHHGDAAAPVNKEVAKPAETTAAPAQPAQAPVKPAEQVKKELTEEQKKEIADAISKLTPEQIEELKKKAVAAGAQEPKKDANGIIQAPNAQDLPDDKSDDDDGLPWWAWTLIGIGVAAAGFGLGYLCASKSEPDVQI